MEDPKPTTPLAAPPKPPEKKDVPLPKPLASLKGTPKDETVRIWARQSKQGIITLCNVKGCYYPLSPVRDPAKNNDPKVGVDKDGRKFVAGLCSYAGAAHGEQGIYPPKKEDEI